MFNAERRWSVTSLILSSVLGLFFYDSAEANDLASALQQGCAQQSAEVDLIKTQLEIADRKHAQLEDLQASGYASWIEVRRHGLVVDSMTERLNSAREMQKVLTDVQAKQESVFAEESPVFRERESDPVKIFLPGSDRVIGWMEGLSLTGLAQTGRAETVPQLISLDEFNRFVTAEQSDELRAATSRVVRAEAAAVGHINSAKHRLKREQQRGDALRRLHAEGYASAHELNVVTDRISKIQSQLDAYVENQKALVEASAGFQDAEAPTSEVTYRSVNSWPAIVLGDKEYALHLVDLRCEYYREQSIANISRLKSDMLQEVTDRLQATPQTKRNGWLASTLNEGRRKEIKAYELETEIEKANMIAARERQQILIHEENRFIQQAIAQYDAARKEIGKSNSAYSALPALVSWVHPIVGIVSSAASNQLQHVGYLESGNLIALARTSNLETFRPLLSEELSLGIRYGDLRFCDGLLFGQSNRLFIGSPHSIDSVSRFKVRHVQSMLLSREQKGDSSSANGTQLDRSWIHDLRHYLARNSRSMLRYSNPSHSRDWSRATSHGHHGCRSLDDHNAYPFGILRSDLRNGRAPKQLPWYLPGSPSNVRSDHVYSRSINSRTMRKR